MEREQAKPIITILRENALDKFASKRDVLPVARDKTNEEILDEFVNLKGVDIYGHAFFEAGVVMGLTMVLELLDTDVLNIDEWKEKWFTPGPVKSETESGKNTQSESSEESPQNTSGQESQLPPTQN